MKLFEYTLKLSLFLISIIYIFDIGIFSYYGYSELIVYNKFVVPWVFIFLCILETELKTFPLILNNIFLKVPLYILVLLNVSVRLFIDNDGLIDYAMIIPWLILLIYILQKEFNFTKTRLQNYRIKYPLYFTVIVILSCLTFHEIFIT
jgi:hypothetical protein